jgi:hypothetical protein
LYFYKPTHKLSAMIQDFRKVVKLFLSVIAAVIVVVWSSSCSWQQPPSGQWVDLFNGKDNSDWIVKIHHYPSGENFGNTFRVEDGTIQVRYDKYGDFNDRFGHLYYRTPFSNFHLSLEYRFTGELQPGAPDYTLLNSGVMFHSQDPRTMLVEQNWPISVEMQFLAGLEDGNPRPTGNMCSPGTDIVFEGRTYDGHCLTSTSKTFTADEWVKAELIVYGDSIVKHVINGDTVLRYSKPTIGGGVVQGYDSTSFKPGTPLRGGYIALQSEGQPIDFRNVKIRILEPK